MLRITLDSIRRRVRYDYIVFVPGLGDVTRLRHVILFRILRDGRSQTERDHKQRASHEHSCRETLRM